jgi:predicted transcriptional regulator
MRINARLDDEAQQQIDYLTAATGQSVSQVVREAVARYHAQTKAQQGGPRRLLAMIGQGDSGHTDTASTVKQVVAEAMAAKYPQHLNRDT